MEQIKSDQIVPSKVADNTVTSIPRDLGQIVGDKRKKSLGLIIADGPGGSTSNPDSISPINDSVEVLNPASKIPSTPQLISIKSQTINIKPDGTAAVDIIIDVEDVRNAVEYEVRITKGAGNL